MASVTGWKKHSARLKRLAGAEPRILRALYALGQKIELDAELSITEGSVSGAGHVPSAPGEPPNADTRLLDSSIETTIESASPPRVLVTSNAPYSAAVELGTAKMVERPFMRPATKKNRAKGIRAVAAAVRG